MIYHRVNSALSMKVKEKDIYKLFDQRLHLLLGSKENKKEKVKFRPAGKVEKKRTGIST